MQRYIARPRAGVADDPDWGPASTSTEILIADDSGWIDTGLVDARGVPLYRERGRIRLGFESSKC